MAEKTSESAKEGESRRRRDASEAEQTKEGRRRRDNKQKNGKDKRQKRGCLENHAFSFLLSPTSVMNIFFVAWSFVLLSRIAGD